MTAQPPIPFSPDLLETYSIIRASPSWKEVEASRQRLAPLLQPKPEPYDKMEIDRDNVLRYVSTLQRSADAITAGVCLAVHLSRFSSSSVPGQRIEDGLRALSSGLDLRSLDEPDTRGELDRCLRAAFPDLKIQTPQMTDITSWKVSLDQALRQIREAALPVPAESQQRARENWKARLLAQAARQTEVPPDIDYLRCRAEGSAPGVVLRGRLKNLTVREWSEGYVAGMSVKPPAGLAMPLWFAFGALGGLGFEVAKELASATSRTSPDEIAEAGQFILRSASGSPRKGVIVLRVGAESLTTNWRVSLVPALVLTAEEYLGDDKIDLKSYFPSRLHGILIEVDRPEQVDAALKRVDVQRVQRKLSCPLALIMSRPPANTSETAGYRAAVSPLEAAAACSETFLAPSTPTP